MTLSGLRWEQHRASDYLLDATGRVVAEVFYRVMVGLYDATLALGGGARIGSYVFLEDAQHAAERAVEAYETAERERALAKAKPQETSGT